jgi:hypothetical protein
MENVKAVKTLKIKVKHKHYKKLKEMAWSVNQVWNYVNALSYRSIRERQTWLSAYDMQKYTAGSYDELGLSSGTIAEVVAEYAIRRNKAKKAKLRFRTFRGSRKNLGWIPFKAVNIKLIDGEIRYNKKL